jgi:hypothetical protein
VKGDYVMVRSTHNPKLAVYIDIKGKHRHDIISHISMTESHMLYIIVDTDHTYEIYERDLAPLVNLFVAQTNLGVDKSKTLKINAKQLEDKPFIIIDKKDIEDHAITKFLIRGAIRGDEEIN